MHIPNPPHIALVGTGSAAVRPFALDPNAARKAVDESLGVGDGDEIEQQGVGQRRNCR